MSEELKPCPCCKQISTVSHLQCSSCLGDRIIPDEESGGARTCSRCLGSGYVTRYSPTTDPELDRLRAENERLREASAALIADLREAMPHIDNAIHIAAIHHCPYKGKSLQPAMNALAATLGEQP